MHPPHTHVIVVGSPDRPTRALLRSLRARGLVTQHAPSCLVLPEAVRGVTVFVQGASAGPRFGERPVLVTEAAGRSHLERASLVPQEVAARVQQLLRWCADGLPGRYGTRAAWITRRGGRDG